MCNEKKLLSLFLNDKIDMSEISDFICDMRRKNEIREKYQEKIKWRKDGRQCYIYINRKQYTGQTETDLLAVLYNLEFGMDDWSMTDLFPQWLKWKRDNTPINPRSLKIYKEQWEKFIQPYPIATVPIRELKSKNFIALFRIWTCKRTLTLKMFNNIKSLINGLYAYAITELEIVSYNPIKEIDRHQFSFQTVNNDDDVFSVKDRNKILSYLKDNEDMYALAIQFDFHVTMRIGELLALEWKDVHENMIYVHGQRLLATEMNDDLTFQKNRYVNVNHTKGYAQEGTRYLPLTPAALKILEKVKKQNPSGKYIFMRDNKHLYTAKFNDRLEKYCNEIDVIPRTSHKIRFTVASMLYENGMSITDLQRLLGHTTTAMTLHYLRKVTPPDSTVNLMSSCLD